MKPTMKRFASIILALSLIIVFSSSVIAGDSYALAGMTFSIFLINFPKIQNIKFI